MILLLCKEPHLFGHLVVDSCFQRLLTVPSNPRYNCLFPERVALLQLFHATPSQAVHCANLLCLCFRRFRNGDRPKLCVDSIAPNYWTAKAGRVRNEDGLLQHRWPHVADSPVQALF